MPFLLEELREEDRQNSSSTLFYLGALEEHVIINTNSVSNFNTRQKYLILEVLIFVTQISRKPIHAPLDLEFQVCSAGI